MRRAGAGVEASMSKEDGGPAFPVLNVHQPWNNDERKYDGVETEVTSSGMTLRDYFAAKAMQAAFAGIGAQQVANRDLRYDETNWSTVVALNAYEMADAMLKARQA
jgi:hypothetical protein